MASDPAWEAASDERLISGFDGSDIGVVAGRRWVERQFGAMYDDVAEVLGRPEAPLAANIGRLSRTRRKAVAGDGRLPLWHRTAECDREARAFRILERLATCEVLDVVHAE